MKLKKLFNKEKVYVAVFVSKQEGSYSFLDKKEFKPSQETIRFENNTYPISPRFPTYSKGLYLYYMIDIDSVEVLSLGGALEGDDYSIYPKLMDMICSKNIISQLTENLTDKIPYTQLITYAVIGAIIGGLLGYILGNIFTMGGV